jgi:hypothetical protein
LNVVIGWASLSSERLCIGHPGLEISYSL